MTKPKASRKHSPLPWKGGGGAITTVDGKWLIADSGDWGGTISEEDIRLIVRAVNSYEVAEEMAQSIIEHLNIDTTCPVCFEHGVDNHKSRCPVVLARKFEEMNRD